MNEIERLTETLLMGRWQWVAVAALLQIVYYLLYTGVFYLAFRLVSVKFKFKDLFPITFSGIFVNSVVPSGGMANYALYVDDARRRGYSSAQSTAGVLVTYICNMLTFIVVLTVSLIFLYRNDRLSLVVFSSASVVFFILASIFVALILGHFKPVILRKLFGIVQITINTLFRILRKNRTLRESWAHDFSADFIFAVKAIFKKPIMLLKILGIGFLSVAANLASLYCIFLAFNEPASLGVLITIYSMIFLFCMVSPTPNGIGIVETIVPLIFVSFGYSIEAGTVISLSFRGITFWIPLMIGCVLLRKLKLFSNF